MHACKQAHTQMYYKKINFSVQAEKCRRLRRVVNPLTGLKWSGVTSQKIVTLQLPDSKHLAVTVYTQINYNFTSIVARRTEMCEQRYICPLQQLQHDCRAPFTAYVHSSWDNINGTFG